MQDRTGASSGGSGRQSTYDELAVEAAVLRAQNIRLHADNDELTARVGGLKARIVELEALVEELRRAGKRQSAPFSKRAPKQSPAKPGRKPGEDYGTHGMRKPPDHVDDTIEAPQPEDCPDCGGELDLERMDDQWIVDIPPVANVITRVRVPVCRCRRCGRRTQGRHPAQTSDALGAAASQVGPRATALAVELHKGAGLSLARTATVLARLGLAVTPGGVCQAVARAGRRAAPTYEAIKSELAASPVISPDETGWRIGGQRAWLWVFATATLTLYHVARGRGFDQAIEVLPADYAGTLVRDGWAPYRRYGAATHQTCLAHLIRRAGELVETLPAEHRWIPRDAAEILRAALGIRDARQRGDYDDATVADALPVLARCVDTLVGLPAGHDANRRFLAHIANERDALFTFLVDPGVDATNWRSEQGVRPAVVNRKVWGGNRTDVGARTQEVLATVLRTAAQQGLDVIALFADLLRSPAPKVAPLNLPLTRPPPG